MFNKPRMNASGFMPDERLARSDADIALYFLSSPGVISTEPSGDKWFRTTAAIGGKGSPGGGPGNTIYGPDVPASPLACAKQYQFCHADQDRCGPLASYTDALIGAAPMFGTTIDILNNGNITEPIAGRFYRLTKTLHEFPIQFMTFGDLGSESLLAQQKLGDGIQGPLPDDQWQREITLWWATTLAGLQTFFVQTAAGVRFPGLEQYRGFEPLEEFEKDMCKNQASLLTGYAQDLSLLDRV